MKQTYAAPTSFVGSTRRLTSWARRQQGPMTVAAWTTIAIALPLIWTLLALWYLIVFGLFGLFTIPFRFLRRGQRKSLAIQREQLELMRKQHEQS